MYGTLRMTDRLHPIESPSCSRIYHPYYVSSLILFTMLRRQPTILSLTSEEVKELELLTTDIVRILDSYALEREGTDRSGYSTPKGSGRQSPVFGSSGAGVPLGGAGRRSPDVFRRGAPMYGRR